MKKEDLRLLVNTMCGVNLSTADGSITDVIRTALGLSAASPIPEVVLICGTAFIMSDARAALGIVEPRDGDVLHELLGSDNIHMQESFNDDVEANNAK
jgi:hypothetical protein